LTDAPASGRVASATLHASALLTMSVFAAVIAMAFLFRIEVVARGKGRIVPVDRVQVVQPEFPGQITAIHVRDGDRARAGDVLIELDDTDAVAELGAMTAERDRLRIERARLDALVDALAPDPDGLDPVGHANGAFRPPSALEAHAFAAEQRALLVAELGDLAASLDQIEARRRAAHRSEAVTDANIARLDAQLAFQAERLKASQQLLGRGATSRSAFLDVQQAFTELERERDVYLREREQKIAERAALDSERRRLLADIRRRSLDRKAQIESRLAMLAQQATAARRRVAASTLTAPTAGVVDQLAVFTIGGVAEAGAELLRIVPSDGDIEIEAVFSNQDIGFMEVGQRANIRFDAYPSERFGALAGAVSDIAADATEAADGTWGFVVRVTTGRDCLPSGADCYSLRPGMTATIDVTTDRRRLASYFFAPIMRTIQDAMGEM
jgi:hemolysin D